MKNSGILNKKKIKLDDGGITHKKCKCCDKLLPISKFAVNKRDYTYKKIYYSSMCKSCKKQYNREMKRKHIESTDYITLKAEKAYASMRQRVLGKNRRDCYKDVIICEEWLNNKQAFIEWFREHYYEIDGMDIVIDKDLLSGECKCYSPNTVCLLPQCINVMLSNSKRHRLPDWKTGSNLPLGVYYNKSQNKYYAKIKYTGADEVQKLPFHDTIEEAFEDYKAHKKDDIKKVADKYKKYLPTYIYDALLNYEIKPY